MFSEVEKCSKCGKCRSVCPVFLASNDEVMSPRGRISLIEALLEGEISDSERYEDTIRVCIKCTRCSSVCPVGIRVERIIQSARDLLAERIGVPDAAREVFRSLLFNPPSFQAALRKAADHNPPESGIPLWLLPLFFHENAHLPELATEAVLDKYPEYIDSRGQRRVALFLGCSVNYVNTEFADSAIEVLKKLKVDVFLPKDQVCCGMPALLFGDRVGAAELARRNVAVLKAGEFDAVVTLCPAGRTTLKDEYVNLLGNEAEELSSKVYDVSEFIDRFTDYRTRRMDMSVTYHDPCYLRYAQGIEAEPRRILARSARLIEMEDADKCCGLGGALGLFHPELSLKMAEAKVKAILESGADAVATGCPGGILFLRQQLAERHIQKDVLHVTQILQMSSFGG